MAYDQPYAKHHYATGYIGSTFDEENGFVTLSTSTATGSSSTTIGNGTSNYGSTQTAVRYTAGNQLVRNSFNSSSESNSSYRSTSSSYLRSNAGGGGTTSQSDGDWLTGSGSKSGTNTFAGSNSNSRTNQNASTSSGFTSNAGGGATTVADRNSQYAGTTLSNGYTSVYTSSYSIGSKIKVFDPTSRFVQRNQTKQYQRTIVQNVTSESVRGSDKISVNSTQSFYTQGNINSGGDPGSIYPPGATDLASQDPNNGAGTPRENDFNPPKITHKSSLGTVTQANYDVQYTDTETVSTEFFYTVSTLSASRNTTTSSTSRRTTQTKPITDWTHPYEPFNITQTLQNYVTETLITNTYNNTKKISIIAGAAAYLTGGDILDNGLVVGNVDTVTSVMFPISTVDFVEYTSDAQSGGALQNATLLTQSKSTSDYNLLSFVTSEITAESHELSNLNGTSFWFGNISDNMLKGGSVTKNQNYRDVVANTRTNGRKYIYEQTNKSAAFNVSSSGSYTTLTTSYQSYLDSNQDLTFFPDSNGSTRSFGVFQSYRLQSTMRSDGNTIVRSRATHESRTSSSAATLKEPVKSLNKQIYSDYGRGTRATNNAFMSGKVYTADKNPLYGGYQAEFTSQVSDAAKKYREITIGDQLIQTTEINNSNVAPISLTINSAVSNTYASSFNLPFLQALNPLRLNSYFTFIPEGRYGNIYTTASNGSVSFEYLENDQSHIIYQLSRTYTSTKSDENGQVYVTSTDKSLMDGLVKVGNAVNFADGDKTAYSQQLAQGYYGSHQQCFGGKTFTDEAGFSFPNGYPINTYEFPPFGSSTVHSSSSNTISTEGNATVSLPPTNLLFAFLPIGIDTKNGNDPYQRCAADFRSTRD
jgi:hypothetical protein